MTLIHPETQTKPQLQTPWGEELIIIGSWEDASTSQLKIQNFIRDGQPFIPVFSDEDHFRNEMQGSGFEESGIFIKRDLLRATLRGDELLILNPGSASPISLRAADLA